MQLVFIHFFFQAEDGIRDFHVTGVQTCALPISALWLAALEPDGTPALIAVFVLGGFSFPMYSLSGSHVNDLVGRDHVVGASSAKIGRAACRERSKIVVQTYWIQRTNIYGRCTVL